LSREIRGVVEERLKAGSLRAIVPRARLELGIDIGSIDEVVLVQPPATVASTVQRLGRSGHQVGERSRGRLYPLTRTPSSSPRVLARAVLDGEIEASRPVANPLDVLAQVLLSMTLERHWPLDELYDAVRAADAYRHLPRAQFDLVVEMLAGRFATTRCAPCGRWRRSTASTRRSAPGPEPTGSCSAPAARSPTAATSRCGPSAGARRSASSTRSSSGADGRRHLQPRRPELAESSASPTTTSSSSRSTPARPWRRSGGPRSGDRSSFLSDRIGRFLETALPAVDDPDCARELEERYRLQPAAAAELKRVLAAQVAATGTLPHRRQIVIRAHHRARP